MRIRWENILPLFFLILIIVLSVKSHLFEFFSRSTESLMYHQSNPLYGFACLGVICITIVGIFAIISNRKR
jgi:hypothetical protein